MFGTVDPRRIGAAGNPDDVVDIDELLQFGESRADGLVDQPAVQAKLRNVLGKILLNRSEVARALPLLEAALATQRLLAGADDPETMSFEIDYARALHQSGELDRARGVLEPMVERLEGREQEHPRLCARAYQALGGLIPGDAGEALLARSLALHRKLPDVDPLEIGSLMTVLATLRNFRGERSEASDLFEQALQHFRIRLDERHPLVIGTRSNVANLLDDPEHRAREQQSILDLRIETEGPSSATVGRSWLFLANTLVELRRADEAEAAYREAERIQLAAGAPTSNRTVDLTRRLARAIDLQGRHGDARLVYQRLLPALDTTRVSANLRGVVLAESALNWLRLGELGSASTVAERALSELEGSAHAWRRALAHDASARVQLATGDLTAAARAAQTALEQIEDAGADDPQRAQVEVTLALARLQIGGDEGARRALERALPVYAGWHLANPSDLAVARAAAKGVVPE